jgi:hypothetical protein
MKVYIVLILLPIIALAVIISLTVSSGEKARIKRGIQTNLKSGSSGKLFIRPELDEVSRKKAGLSGPFPVDEDVPEKERSIGLLTNAWREAIVTKNIKDIERLNLEISRFDKESIPFLRKLASEDKNERVRAFAVRVLGRKKSPDLAQLFTELGLKDASEFVRENCIWSLQQLADKKNIPVLEQISREDKSEKLRNMAKEAINTIDSSRKNK